MKLDFYNVQARLKPALIALFPAALGTFAWVGPSQRWLGIVWTLFGTAGGTYLLGVIARDRGKQIEARLWKSWGGAPTTQLLRHSGPANPVSRSRWHKNLTELFGMAMPTPEQELADPGWTDATYEAAARLLIGIRRDERLYPLVREENIAYGFCRNLYAMRSIGIVISFLGAISALAAARAASEEARYAPYIYLLICCGFIGWWLSVRHTIVRVSAFAYSERLLESSDSSSAALTKSKRSKSVGVKQEQKTPSKP